MTLHDTFDNTACSIDHSQQDKCLHGYVTFCCQALKSKHVNNYTIPGAATNNEPHPLSPFLHQVTSGEALLPVPTHMRADHVDEDDHCSELNQGLLFP